MMKTNGHGIIYNNKVFFVQPMELPCDDTKKFSLESVPKKNPNPLCQTIQIQLFYITNTTY